MNETVILKELLCEFETELEVVMNKLSSLEDNEKIYLQGYRDGLFEAFHCVADKIDRTTHSKTPYITKLLNK